MLWLGWAAHRACVQWIEINRSKAWHTNQSSNATRPSEPITNPTHPSSTCTHTQHSEAARRRRSKTAANGTHTRRRAHGTLRLLASPPHTHAHADYGTTLHNTQGKLDAVVRLVREEGVDINQRSVLRVLSARQADGADPSCPLIPSTTPPHDNPPTNRNAQGETPLHRAACGTLGTPVLEWLVKQVN